MSQKSFNEQKFCSPFIYKKLLKNGVEIFKKILNTCHLPKKTPSGSLDNTFLHKPCKFEQNRLSGTREILTTARGLAENGIAKWKCKTTDVIVNKFLIIYKQNNTKSQQFKTVEPIW